MGTPGLLTKDKFGYSMPVDAPLYLPPPLFYEDTRIMLFPYLTDAARAAALLPAPLELVTVDSQGTLALAEMIYAKYPFSTVGAYNEVAQTLAVTYKGQPGAYAVRLHVTNDQALVAGREIGGFPKRHGRDHLRRRRRRQQHARVPGRRPRLHGGIDADAAGAVADIAADHLLLAARDAESGRSAHAVGLRARAERVAARGGHVLVGAWHDRRSPAPPRSTRIMRCRSSS